MGRARRRGRGRGRRRSQSRPARSASTLEADLRQKAGESGVSVTKMIEEAGKGAGPDVPAGNVGPRKSKTRRARRGKSRRRNNTEGGEDSPIRRRRSRRKESSGNEIAQQLQ